jgi:hypothetical protein
VLRRDEVRMGAVGPSRSQFEHPRSERGGGGAGGSARARAVPPPRIEVAAHRLSGTVVLPRRTDVACPTPIRGRSAPDTPNRAPGAVV